MLERSSRILAVVAAVVVMSAVIGGAVAATPTGSTSASDNETENGTAPHQNPDEIDEVGDDRRVAEYLTERLGDRLTASAIALGEGEYESGREPLGEEYGSLLDKYSVVATDLDEEESARRYNLTRERQRELADSVEETETLVEEYQRAVENGNDERARELAREILDSAAEVNETTTDLEQQYAALSEEAGVDLGEAERAVEEIRRTTGEAAVAIEDREFTDSRIAVETDRTTVSAADPVEVSGRLTTTNGAPIDDGLIRVGFGNDTVTTRTTDSGTFETTYRPVSAPLNDSNLTVRYEPSSTDPFLSTTEVVSVRIVDQAETTIDIANATETAAFDETVRTTASVRVSGVDGRLDGIPLVLTASGDRIATAETDPEGQAVLTGQLPATVPTGDGEFRVAIEREDLAVAASTASTPVEVRSTPTVLSVNATTNATNQTVVASGRLTTEDGTGIPDRSVRISVGETDLGRVVTDDTGRYQATFTLPETIERRGEPALTATFLGTGTNLEGSSDSRSLSLPSEGFGSSVGSAVELITEMTDSAVLIGVVSLALVAFSIIVFRNRLFARVGPIGPWAGKSTETRSTTASGSVSRSVTGPSGADPRAGSNTSRSLLARAASLLTAGRLNRAVQTAYAGVRARLSSGSEPSTETHREFYERWKREDDVDTMRLKEITAAYEAAAFAKNDVSAEAADDVVTASDELVDGRDGS